MRKGILFTLLLFTAVLLTAGEAAAYSGYGENSVMDPSGIELPETAREMLGSAGAEEGGALFKKVAGAAETVLSEAVSPAVKSAASLLTICVVFSAVGTFFDRDGIADGAVFCAAVAVTAIGIGSTRSFMGIGMAAMDELDLLSKSLMPVLAAAMSASGNVSSGAAIYAATLLFMNLLMTAATRWILPLIYLFTICSAAGAALEEKGLSAAAGFIRWVIITSLVVLTLAFSVYLTVSRILSATADQAAIKLTKTAVTTFLPVVGSMISDAAGALTSGITAIRNSIGIMGLAAVCAVCTGPFIRLGVHYLAFRAAASLAGPLAGKKLGSVIGSLSSSFAMILGVTGVSAIFLFIAILSVIRTVTVY